MKIGVLSDLFYPFIGGGEVYLLNLEKGLTNRGFEIIHLTTKLPSTSPREEINGIKLIRINIPTKNFMKGRFLYPFLLFPHIKLLKNVSLLHVTTYPAAVTGWLIGKVLNKPTVVFCHNFFNEYWFKIRNKVIASFFILIEKYIGKCPYSFFLCPSFFLKKMLIKAGVPERKIKVIYHGIDPIFNPKVDGSTMRRKFNLEDKLVFGFAGRLSDIRQKGISYLLKATQLVVRELPQARLVLAGTGFEKIKNLVDSLKINRYVIYVGKLPFKKLPEFYAMCDIIVGASIFESFGFMYAEASRCGKPVVAPKVGAIPEIIINGKSGILVEPENSKALATAILNLLTDRKKAKKMGKIGALYTKKFTWERSVDQHVKIFKTLIEG